METAISQTVKDWIRNLSVKALRNEASMRRRKRCFDCGVRLYSKPDFAVELLQMSVKRTRSENRCHKDRY